MPRNQFGGFGGKVRGQQFSGRTPRLAVGNAHIHQRRHNSDKRAKEGRHGRVPRGHAENPAHNHHRQRQANLPAQQFAYSVSQLLGQSKHELRDYTHRASVTSMNCAVLYKTAPILNI